MPPEPAWLRRKCTGLENRKSLVRSQFRHYSLRRLLTAIGIGFVPLSQLSIVSIMVMKESSQWLGKNIMRGTGKKELQESLDSYTGLCDVTEIVFKTALTHYLMTNFRLFQTERLCRRQFEI